MSRSEIDRVNAKLMAAVRAGDPSAAAALYTEDACLLAPNQPMLAGRAAIAAFFEASGEMGARALQLETRELEIRDDTAHEMGSYALLDADSKTLDVGKYLVFWQRRDGVWQLHRDMLNSDLPPAGNPQ